MKLKLTVLVGHSVCLYKGLTVAMCKCKDFVKICNKLFVIVPPWFYLFYPHFKTWQLYVFWHLYMIFLVAVLSHLRSSVYFKYLLHCITHCTLSLCWGDLILRGPSFVFLSGFKGTYSFLEDLMFYLILWGDLHMNLRKCTCCLNKTLMKFQVRLICNIWLLVNKKRSFISCILFSFHK